MKKHLKLILGGVGLFLGAVSLYSSNVCALPPKSSLKAAVEADLNEQLLSAAQHGNLGEIKRLIEHGANDFSGAITVASANNHIDVVDYFIFEKEMYSPNITLCHAAAKGRTNDIVALCDKTVALADSTYSPKEADSKSAFLFTSFSSAIDSALQGEQPLAITEILKEVNRKFKESGRDPELALRLINHVFVNAAALGSLHLMGFAQCMGANNFDVALECATNKGHLKVMSCLVPYGAKIPSEKSWCGVMQCAPLEAIQYLVDNTNTDNLNLDKALLAVITNHGDIAVMQFLVANGANNLNSALFKAAKVDNIEAMQFLAGIGARISSKEFWDKLIERASFESIQYLAENTNTNNLNLNRALQVAVSRRGNSKTIEFQNGRGKIVGKRVPSFNFSGYSVASDKENSDLIDYLIQKGANPNEALIMAASNDSLSTVQCLIDKTNASDLYGAYSVAIKNNSKDISDFLKKELDRQFMTGGHHM